jgi:F-type H+-transporting ATPase subunit b
MSVLTYIAQIVNFLVFVVILYLLLYKPVRRIMQQRKEEMEATLREAEDKLRKAEDTRAAVEQQAKELDEKRDSILKEARDQAEAHRKDVLEKLERQARDRLERFRRIMEQERTDLLDKISGELRDTIVEVAGSVLRDASIDLMDRAVPRIEQLLDEIPPDEIESVRKTVREAESPVLVRSSGPITDEQQTRLKDLLTQKLSIENVELQLTEDPSLLSGLEVTLGHLQLEAHWRHVIDEALKAKTSEENPAEESAEESRESPADSPGETHVERNKKSSAK